MNICLGRKCQGNGPEDVFGSDPGLPALRLVMPHLLFLKTPFRGAALAPLATHVNLGTTQGLSFLVFKLGARIAHFPYAEG